MPPDRTTVLRYHVDGARRRGAVRQKHVDAAMAAHMMPAPGNNVSLDVSCRLEDAGECSLFMTCSWVSVLTARDCPNGVHLAANVASDGVVVASGNKITGSLRAGEPATLRVDCPGGPVDGSGGAEVTAVHCL